MRDELGEEPKEIPGKTFRFNGGDRFEYAGFHLGIIESKRIRDHIKRKEEAEKAGRVFVDGGKKIGGKRDNFNTQSSEKPKGWLASKLESLQQKADQMQRDAKRGRPKS